MDEPAAVKMENLTVIRRDTLTVRMRAGGGFVARFDLPGSAGASHRS
jgi:hypothetical protein